MGWPNLISVEIIRMQSATCDTFKVVTPIHRK